jgi:hypothetical protein
VPRQALEVRRNGRFLGRQAGKAAALIGKALAIPGIIHIWQP